MTTKNLILSTIVLAGIAVAAMVAQGVSAGNLEYQAMQTLKGSCWDCWEDQNCMSCQWNKPDDEWVKCSLSTIYYECMWEDGTDGEVCETCDGYTINCGSSFWNCGSTDNCAGICVDEGACDGCYGWGGDEC